MHPGRPRAGLLDAAAHALRRLRYPATIGTLWQLTGPDELRFAFGAFGEVFLERVHAL